MKIMGWFQKLMRDAGLMFHHIAHPTEKRVVNKQVDEVKITPSVTLRRTTIDEVEIDKTEPRKTE